MPHHSLREQYKKDQRAALGLIRQVDSMTGLVPESWDCRSYEAFREAVIALKTTDIRALDEARKGIECDAPAYVNIMVACRLCTLSPDSIYGLMIRFRPAAQSGDPFARKNLELLRGDISPREYKMPPDAYLYEAIDYAGVPRNFYDLSAYLSIENDDKAAILNLKAMQADFAHKKSRGDNVVDGC